MSNENQTPQPPQAGANLPCPICRGIGGCDHTVPERKRAAPAAPAVAPILERWQHQKSGVVYQVLTDARMEGNAQEMVVYRSEKDGRVWVRPATEFYGVKFKRAADAAPAPAEPKGEQQATLTEQVITDAVKQWFPDRAYQAPFFARALLRELS